MSVRTRRCRHSVGVYSLRVMLTDDDEEEALLKIALIATLDGVDTHNIGDTTCAGRTRRFLRGLLGSADSVTISCSLAFSTSSFGDNTTAADVSLSVISSLGTAVSSGMLTSNLASAATAANSTSTIGAAVVTSASAGTLSPTLTPSQLPSTKPIPNPTALPTTEPPTPGPTSSATHAPTAMGCSDFVKNGDVAIPLDTLFL